MAPWSPFTRGYTILPRHKQQSDIPSQHFETLRPAQTFRQPDVAQFAGDRADIRAHKPKPLGAWQPPFDPDIPKARTAIRLATIVAGTMQLLLPENPSRSFFFVTAVAAECYVSMGRPPGFAMGFLVSIGNAAKANSPFPPGGFGGGAIPIDEIWGTVDVGHPDAQVCIFEGVPTMTGPNYDRH